MAELQQKLPLTTSAEIEAVGTEFAALRSNFDQFVVDYNNQVAAELQSLPQDLQAIRSYIQLFPEQGLVSGYIERSTNLLAAVEVLKQGIPSTTLDEVNIARSDYQSLVANYTSYLDTYYIDQETELNRLKDNQLVYSADIFPLALRIKRAILADSSGLDIVKFANLKSQLPQTVQILIWNVETVLVNEAYPNEYLYSSIIEKDADRRWAFSWTPGGTPEPKAPYVFSTVDDGKSFSIKSSLYNEYLYPDTEVENSWKLVLLWRPGTLEPTFSWNIELLSDTKIRIKSATYGEYFFSHSSTVLLDPIRRHVYYGMTDADCDLSCNWSMNLVN
jgi:hypothetical protein